VGYGGGQVSTRASPRPQIEKVARKTFGWKELRPGQLEAVQSVTRERDTLVVMTTGSGKSAIYQLPAVSSKAPRWSSRR
jgi:ATP-dependent DNA helicase RecQ